MTETGIDIKGNISDPDEQMVSIVKELLGPAMKERQKALDAHDKLRNSQPFIDALKYNSKIFSDFILFLNSVSMMSTRATFLSDHTISIRMTDYFLQSSIAITYMIENGMHAPAKRELRFILECGIKFLASDQQVTDHDIIKKVEYLNDLKIRFEDIYKSLNFSAFDAQIKQSLTGEISDLYAKLSVMVHVSHAQISQDINNWERGTPIGFENVPQINKLNELCKRVLDVAVILSAHALGIGLTGDIFTNILDENKKWVFHKTKFTKLLSSTYNYKHERT